MAVSFSSCSLYHRFHRHPPLAPALPLSPPAIRPLLATSRNRRVLARGKFEKFDRVDSSAGNPAPSPPDSAQSETPDQERPQESEDDRFLKTPVTFNPTLFLVLVAVLWNCKVFKNAIVVIIFKNCGRCYRVLIGFSFFSFPRLQWTD